MATLGFVGTPSPGREWPCNGIEPFGGSGMVDVCTQLHNGTVVVYDVQVSMMSLELTGAGLHVFNAWRRVSGEDGVWNVKRKRRMGPCRVA